MTGLGIPQCQGLGSSAVGTLRASVLGGQALPGRVRLAGFGRFCLSPKRGLNGCDGGGW